ncbi:hypothetical protein ACVAQ8_004539, partial [Escherichia coli]
TGGIEGCVAVTHDKNLHIAPLLLTRFARFLSSETRERKRWPALCLIHSPNETLFFTSMA